MDNIEKLERKCTQDEDKQYVLDITIRKHTKTTQIRSKPSYKQLEVKIKYKEKLN
jgi:hypothetical protein